MYNLIRACCFIAFLFVSLDSAMSQLVMETPSITAAIGSTVTLSARSTSGVLSTSNVNWYALGTAVTSNGALSASSSKYSVYNNGTVFKLTIITLSSSDFGIYTLLYLNVPTTLISLNASITQYTVTTATPYVACDSTGTTIAIFILLMIGYLMLVVTNTLMFTITRSQRNKIECCDVTMLVLFLQLSMAFITVLFVIWITSFSLTQYANYLISSLFGLGSYLLIWVGILYFIIMFVKEENLSYVIVITLVGILVFQVGMYIGVIICVTHCGYTTVMPTITLDYGRLGIIFAVMLVVTCAFLMIWSAVFYKQKGLKESMLTVTRRGREIILSPGSMIASFDNATRTAIAGSKGGSKIVPVPSTGVSSMAPQPSKLEKVVTRLPKPIQQFIRSMQRKFKKESDEDFKNLVVSVDPKDAKGKKPDPKAGKANGLAKATPRQSTIGDIKADKSKAGKDDKSKGGKDKDKKASIDATAQASKSKLPDTSKQTADQQQQQDKVGSKTQQLQISSKGGKDIKEGAKDAKDAKDTKDSKDPKRKKDSTPVQVQPVIQVPGQVPPSDDKKSKKDKKKKKGKKKRDEDDDDDDDDETAVDDDEDDEKDDDDDDDDEDDDDMKTKNSEDEDEDDNDDDDDDDDDDSETDKKKSKKGKKSEKSKSKSKKKKK